MEQEQKKNKTSSNCFAPVFHGEKLARKSVSGLTEGLLSNTSFFTLPF